MKKIFLSLYICAGIAFTSACTSNKATNAADGNNSVVKADSTTAKAIDSSSSTTDTKPDTPGKSGGAGTGPSNGVNQSKSDTTKKKM